VFNKVKRKYKTIFDFLMITDENPVRGKYIERRTSIWVVLLKNEEKK